VKPLNENNWKEWLSIFPELEGERFIALERPPGISLRFEFDHRFDRILVSNISGEDFLEIKGFPDRSGMGYSYLKDAEALESEYSQLVAAGVFRFVKENYDRLSIFYKFFWEEAESEWKIAIAGTAFGGIVNSCSPRMGMKFDYAEASGMRKPASFLSKEIPYWSSYPAMESSFGDILKAKSFEPSNPRIHPIGWVVSPADRVFKKGEFPSRIEYPEFWMENPNYKKVDGSSFAQERLLNIFEDILTLKAELHGARKLSFSELEESLARAADSISFDLIPEEAKKLRDYSAAIVKSYKSRVRGI
jgi:hypothetical protein